MAITRKFLKGYGAVAGLLLLALAVQVIMLVRWSPTGFTSSLLANVVILVWIAGGGYLLSWLGGRRRFLRFFIGQDFLVPRSTQFVIYISTGENTPGGVASVWELTEVRNLYELFFSLVPGASGGPGLFRDCLASGLECDIKPVREGDNPDILATNCLVVGSPTFNDAAQRYQDDLRSPVRFERTVPVDRHSVHRLCVPGERPNEDDRRGIIVRICRDGKSYFYAAGRTVHGTAGAVYLLRRNWRGLYRRFGADKSFFVQVEVRSDDYRLASEIGRSEL